MNNTLKELGVALGNAKLELNNLIVEFEETKDDLNIDSHNSLLMSIGIKSIEVRNLNEKWDEAEYAEFMDCPEPDDEVRLYTDDDEIDQERSDEYDSLRNGTAW